jgi:YVTN family beta-propeller protein
MTTDEEGNPTPDYVGTISVIDTQRNMVINTIIVGGEPLGIAITPDEEA